MSDICVQSQFLLSLIDEIGRTRALHDHETDILEAIITKGHQSRGINFRWTASLNTKLLVASASKGGIKRFAERHGITDQSARTQIKRLRKAQLRNEQRKG